MSRRQFERLITIETNSILPANKLATEIVTLQNKNEPQQQTSNSSENVIHSNASDDVDDSIMLSVGNHSSSINSPSEDTCIDDTNLCMPLTSIGCDNNSSLENKLRHLISKYHVSHNFINELLIVLRSEGLKLPKDVRTLLKTPRAHEIVNIHPGSYIHIGIEFLIRPILEAYYNQLHDISLIKLSLNIDGLPLTKSSKSSFWPILISFVDILELSQKCLPVGIYHGQYKKPTSIFEFLNPFINEMQFIKANGIKIKNKVFRFDISLVVCDSPAKAFILNVKQHNAYHSCNSCIEEGTFLNNRISYSGINSQLRTNESFRSKKDEDYHKGISPLEMFPDLNITDAVVLEYMHCVCLGVMKRLLLFWKKGKKPHVLLMMILKMRYQQILYV